MKRTKVTIAKIPVRMLRNDGGGSALARVLRTRGRLDLPVLLLLFLLAPAEKDGAYTTTWRLGAYARMLGLDDPDLPHAKNAVSDALRRLQREGLIRVERTGHKQTVRLLEPGQRDATGLPIDYQGAGGTTTAGGTDQRYLPLHREFFANGWHVALSPRALLVYLVALDQDSRKNRFPGASLPTGTRHRFSTTPSELCREYGASTSSFEKAWQELRQQGLIDVLTTMVDDDRYVPHRTSQRQVVYQRLATPPTVITHQTRQTEQLEHEISNLKELRRLARAKGDTQRAAEIKQQIRKLETYLLRIQRGQ